MYFNFVLMLDFINFINFIFLNIDKIDIKENFVEIDHFFDRPKY